MHRLATIQTITDNGRRQTDATLQHKRDRWYGRLKTFPSPSTPDSRHVGVWFTDATLEKTSTEADVNQTYYNGTTTGPAVTEERTPCTNASRHAENDTSIDESVQTKGDRNLFPWPAWLFDNGSVSDHSMLEELIKKHKDDMVRPSGKYANARCMHYMFTVVHKNVSVNLSMSITSTNFNFSATSLTEG